VRKDGWARGYCNKIIARFENDVFPWIGKVPVAELTAPQLLEVIRRIKARGVVATAQRALQDGSPPPDDPPAAGSHAPDRARSIDDLPAAGSRAVSRTGAAVGACRGLATDRR